MGTISAALPTIGGQRGDGEAAVRNALSAIITEFNGSIDSANMKNAPLVLLSSLTASRVFVNGTAFADLELYAASATSGSRRSALSTQAGTTVLNSLSDDGSAVVKTGLSMDHLSGNVSFPSQMKKSIIPATESRNNAAYGTLPTPDQVTVVLPTDGLLKILFQATWQDSVSGAGRAAIFIGANQLKSFFTTDTSPAVNEATGPTSASDALLFTSPELGLQSGPVGYTGDVTTGQIVGAYQTTTGIGGGPIYVFAAAGTYTVSVQFKASSGSVTAKNRKLWVGVESYG